MKVIISLLSIAFISTSLSFAETTQNNDYAEDIETGETAAACAMRIKKTGYNIRTRPKPARKKARKDICGNTSNITTAQPLDIEGNWVKIKYPNCPNRTAYVWYEAIEPSDLAAFRSGQCRMSLNYGYRNPPPAPAPKKNTTVKSKKSSHQFPLNSCQGIRNDRYGSGYYGARRGGGRRTHAGCDYKAPLKAPLTSPCVGRVTTAPNAGAAGNLLTVLCDNGDKFRMMHLLNNSMIKNGSRVGAGSYVGKVGKTGNANNRRMQTHLHIEAIIQGRRANPTTLWNCP